MLANLSYHRIEVLTLLSFRCLKSIQYRALGHTILLRALIISLGCTVSDKLFVWIEIRAIASDLEIYNPRKGIYQPYPIWRQRNTGLHCVTSTWNECVARLPTPLLNRKKDWNSDVRQSKRITFAKRSLSCFWKRF